MLLAGVVGSGIMAERLAGGNAAIALLANALATGGVLVAIILAFGPISGAHFNPAVTLADAVKGGLPWREVPAYLVAQIGGAVAGVVVANLMFGEPAVFFSQHAFAVAAYIVGAYWFTASTSFANPAVTIARSLSDTFTGIAPRDVPAFIAAELLGAFAATLLFTWLRPDSQ